MLDVLLRVLVHRGDLRLERRRVVSHLLTGHILHGLERLRGRSCYVTPCAGEAVTLRPCTRGRHAWSP